MLGLKSRNAEQTCKSASKEKSFLEEHERPHENITKIREIIIFHISNHSHKSEIVWKQIIGYCLKAAEVENKIPCPPKSASEVNKMADKSTELLFGQDLEAIFDLLDGSDFEKEVEEIDCEITEDVCIAFPFYLCILLLISH